MVTSSTFNTFNNEILSPHIWQESWKNSFFKEKKLYYIYSSNLNFIVISNLNIGAYILTKSFLCFLRPFKQLSYFLIFMVDHIIKIIGLFNQVTAVFELHEGFR